MEQAPAQEQFAQEPQPDSKLLVTARGVWAAFFIAVRRLTRSKFMIANLILTGIPLAICTIIVFAMLSESDSAFGVPEIHERYEALLRVLYLHFIVYFLANVFGFAVVRQEIEGQTLHYLLLQPAQRWALFLGRYLAYIAIVSFFCIGSLWLGYLILMLPMVCAGDTVKDLFVSGRSIVLLKESGVLALGLAAYGAVAMLAGSFFKTAMYAVILLVWEWVLPYVPQALKEWTILYYLQSLLPEKTQKMQKLFELLGDLAPAWKALLVLFLLTATALAGAMTVFHFKECQYAEN